MKVSDRALNIWYRCALALCGAVVLVNLWQILDNQSSSPVGMALLLAFVGAVYFVFQKNRACQLAGWICGTYSGLAMFLLAVEALMSRISQLKTQEWQLTFLWSNIEMHQIEHHRDHAVVDVAFVAIFGALAVPAIWLLIREISRQIREEDLAKFQSEAKLEEILSTPAMKIEKPKASEASEEV